MYSGRHLYIFNDEKGCDLIYLSVANTVGSRGLNYKSHNRTLTNERSIPISRTMFYSHCGRVCHSSVLFHIPPERQKIYYYH